MKKTLKSFFSRRTAKLYTAFVMKAVEIFETTNSTLQSENSQIHKVRRVIEKLVADISLRGTTKFRDMKYFIDRFPCLRDNFDLDVIEAEFNDYQTLKEEDLPLDLFIIPSATEMKDPVHRPAEEQWKLMAQLIDCTGSQRFNVLPRLMMIILLIPVANACCERVFSTVRKNKTDFRSCLAPDTLEALMLLKSRGGICHLNNHSETLLRKCKSTTRLSLKNH
ncbi:uncharacterized protein LOC141907677 [Tubulanus polymorphus]|uniref:uncharacterized protein LOC141907677 n=1 Tax=Tubulanus polymorphus TaxID=672921 RepID=UPI003DA248CC